MHLLLCSHSFVFINSGLEEMVSGISQVFEEHRCIPITFILGSLSLVFFLPFISDALVNGDIAVYNEQIDTLNLSIRTVHWGYYVIGIIFSRLLPFSTDLDMNLMSAIFGALGIVFVFLITLKLTGNRMASFVAALILLSSEIWMINSIFAEVYIVQASLILLSYLLWVSHKGTWAGFAFLWALLVTPSSICALPGLLIKKASLRQYIRFALIVFPLFALFIAIHSSDYLFGGRGVIQSLASGMSWDSSFRKGFAQIRTNFLAVSLFIGLGCLQELLHRREKAARVAVAAFSSFIVTALLADKSAEPPAQLPTYTLLAILGGVGFWWITKQTWFQSRYISYLVGVLTLLLIGTNMSSHLGKTFRFAESVKRYKWICLEVNRVACDGYIAISGWSRGVLFEHYVYGKSYTGHWLAYEWIGVRGHPHQRQWQQVLEEGKKEVWILEKPAGNILDQLNEYGYQVERYGEVWRAIPPCLLGQGEKNWPFAH